MIFKNNFDVRKLFFVVLTFIPLLLFVIIRFPVFAMNLDEAGQYWMALGQNHFSPFYSMSGGFMDAVTQNKLYNLDPGGFTFILHFWLKISHHYFWVKLLPLIFFIGFIVYLVKLLKLFIKDNKDYAFLIIPILFISNAIPLYGVFLRAYSMEYFGIAISLYYLFSAKKAEQFYLKAGLLCALILWSRYGFGIHIVALYCASLLKFKDSFNRKAFLINSLYFGIPIIISMVLIYVVTLKSQFIKPTVNPSYFQYMSDGSIKKTWELIYQQLTSFINLPLIILVLIYIFRKKIYFIHDGNSFRINYLKLIILYFGFYHLVNFILSYFGLYPYSPKSYNSKQFEFFNILCIFFLAVFFVRFFANYRIIILVTVIGVGSYLAINKKNQGSINLLYLLNKYNAQACLFVSTCNYPTTRYLIEQKIFSPKYTSIEVYKSDSLVNPGSIIFYNELEHIYYHKINFDSTYLLIEKLKSKNPTHNSIVYLKK